ncbi:hypothetical protein AB1K70_24850 [Bremerella sp. JC770]|uniref:hypothetical protein n=1 Tax=Bremerella sp. JC770 TaxID=3232137 RepID=UPI00345A3D59
MSTPINSGLFKALERAFGRVLIGNEGGSYIPTTSTYNGRRGSPPAHAGEYYRVSCPHCRDTGHRLWINHMWGSRLDGADDRDDHLYLINCFNEGCFETRDDQKELYDKLFPFNYGRRERTSQWTAPSMKQARQSVTRNNPPVTLPGGTLPLSDAASHAAVNYLIQRGFNLEELVQRWGVQYCPFAPHAKPRILDRIIIPIYDLRPTMRYEEPFTMHLTGWQSRYIGAPVPAGQQKYLTMAGLKKSQLLYGLPQAVNHPGSPVVIVEGVTDAWRFQRDAVSTLGKGVSQIQLQLLVRHFSGRPIVVFFDRDASQEAQRAAKEIRAIRRTYGNIAPVVVGTLPDGRQDIGECTREEAWSAVWHAINGSRHASNA